MFSRFFLVFLLIFGFVSYAWADCAGWCPPTAGPTSAAGASVPLNTSATGQTKTGSLTLGALGDPDITHGNLNVFGVGSFNNGLGIFSGNFLLASGQPAWGKVLMATSSTGLATWVATSTLGLSGGSSQWTTSGNNIYNSNSGNVGIGTNGPGLGLTVMKDNGNGWAGWFSAASNAGAVGLGTQSGIGAIHGFTSAGQVGNLSINSSGGNVGIGTTAPVGKLQVGNGSGTADVRVSDGTGTIAVGSSPGVFRMQTDGSSIRFLSSSNGYAHIQAQSIQFPVLDNFGNCNPSNLGVVFLRNSGSGTNYDLCACVKGNIYAGFPAYYWQMLNNGTGSCPSS